MIIKICKSDGYNFFECDSLEAGTILWGNRQVLTPQAQFFLNPNVKDRSEATEFSKNKSLPYTLRLLDFKKGEKHFTIVTDVLTYLMNDEGKTIDRIN